MVIMLQMDHFILKIIQPIYLFLNAGNHFFTPPPYLCTIKISCTQTKSCTLCALLPYSPAGTPLLLVSPPTECDSAYLHCSTITYKLGKVIASKLNRRPTPENCRLPCSSTKIISLDFHLPAIVDKKILGERLALVQR